MDPSVSEVFENTAHPMCACDVHTLGFLSANEAALRALGFAWEELCTMTLNDILSQEDAAAIVHACVTAASTQLPLRLGPLMLRKKDGTAMTSDIHCQAIPFEGKDAIFLLLARPRR